MDFQTVVSRYWKFAVSLLAIYLVVVGTYFFVGYGTLENSTGSYLFINGVSYGQTESVKLRPGTYKIVARTEESEIIKDIFVKPFTNTPITLQKNDLTSIVQRTLDEKTLIVSQGKILNSKWLVALASNDEISKVVVLQYQNGSWVEVTEYVLPEVKSKVNKDYFTKILPPYINDYIKQDLLK